jgi:hypothetical protein
MSPDRRIDELIEAGWNVLNTDFNLSALQDWREKAFHFLLAELGTDHPYTRKFSDYVRPEGKECLLAGQGVLIAAKEGRTLVSSTDRV